MAYDSLLILAIWFLSIAIPVMLNNSGQASDQTVSSLTVQLICVGELLAFFLFFWHFRDKTLGMLAWHMHLRNSEGGKPSNTQLLLRLAGALIGFAALGLGYLWIIIDPEKRSWSDLISNTRVLND